MAGALGHRGPDEFGVYRDRRAGLAHARLSIIDLATGQQPLSNERGTLWIVVQRRDLQLPRAARRARSPAATGSEPAATPKSSSTPTSSGAPTRSGASTASGPSALWDAERRELVLARDPFGVRPLYVAEHDGRLSFASEVKALFAGGPGAAAPARSRRPRSALHVLDAGGAADGLRGHRGSRARHRPRSTPSSGVSQHARPTIRRFPPTRRRSSTGTLDDAVEEVASGARARRRACACCAPTCRSAATCRAGSTARSIAALGPSRQGLELRDVLAAVRRRRVRRDASTSARWPSASAAITTRCSCRAATSRASFPEVISHTERPILRTAPAPLYLLSKLVHDAGIKVVLTGEGADEMFAGYDLFREAKVRRFWAAQPASERAAAPARAALSLPRALAGGAARDGAAVLRPRLERGASAGFGHDPRWRGTSALKRLFSADAARAAVGAPTRTRRCWPALPPGFARWSPLAQDQYLEVHTLLSGYLLSSQGDRMLMAHSVEGGSRSSTGTWPRSPSRCRLRTSCGCSTRSTSSSARRADLVPAVDPGARSSRIARRTRCRLPRAEAQEWIDEVASPRPLSRGGRASTRRRSAQLLAKCARARGGRAVLERRQHGRRRRAVDAARAPSFHPAAAIRSRRRPAVIRTRRRSTSSHRDQRDSDHAGPPSSSNDRARPDARRRRR